MRPEDPVDDLQTDARGHDPETTDNPQPTRSADRMPRVVVGIDGSAESRSALHWAIGQANLVGGDVEAVAVWHQPLQFGASALAREPEKDFENDARGWLAAAIPEGADAAGVPVHAHTERGEPATVLLDHAMRADLLVVGNRGRGGLAGAMVGSVAQRVAHHARCPVVLVPTPPAADETPSR